MKQDYKRVEELVERFFEGQTSNDEEQELYAFFANENIPEHLLPYRQVFAYFEIGIEEAGNQIAERKNIQSAQSKKIRFWIGIAASLLILISFGISHFIREKEFYPYEGSYIVRNGVKITDPKMVNPEIEKTLYPAQLQEEKNNQLLRQLKEMNKDDPYEQAVKEIKRQHLEWIDRVEDENVRSEMLKIMNLEL